MYRVLYLGLCTCLLFHTGDFQFCNETMTDETGVLLSPNYPNLYENNLGCSWEVNPDTGGRIVIRFHAFDVYETVDCKGDSVTIIDVKNNNKKILDRACGLQNASTLISDTDMILIVFITDQSGVSTGFNMSWTVCGGIFESEEGDFSSPSLDFEYPEFTCTFHLRIPDSQTTIEVTFDDISLVTSSGDCLIHVDADTITEGQDFNCSRPTALVSNTNEITIVLTMVYNKTSILRGSFRKFECNSTTTSTSGTIQSPFFPAVFTPDSTCDNAINITVLPGKFIDITFHDVTIPCNSSDSLQIFSLKNGGLGDVISVCEKDESTTLSLDHSAGIRFTSVYDEYDVRFNLAYSLYDCDEFLKSPSGIIQSPMYPDDYFRSSICNYYLNFFLPVGAFVQVDFHDVTIPCNGSDSLKIVNENQMNSSDSIDVCESYSNATLYFNESTVFIFSSVDEKYGVKFNATYTLHACGGLFEDTEGTFTSLVHLFGHPVYICTFRLVVPEDRSAIEIFFDQTNFQTSSGECLLQIDPAQIAEGQGLNCSNPEYLLTESNEITINLTMVYGLTPNLKGSFKQYDCNQLLEATSGTIQSPSYPLNFSSNSICDYTFDFTLQYDESLELEFHDISIDCNGSDSLHILYLDGGNPSDVISVCEDDVNTAYNFNRSVLIRFSSMNDDSNVRFNASYAVYVSYTTTPMLPNDSNTSTSTSSNPTNSTTLYTTVSTASNSTISTTLYTTVSTTSNSTISSTLYTTASATLNTTLTNTWSTTMSTSVNASTSVIPPVTGQSIPKDEENPVLLAAIGAGVGGAVMVVIIVLIIKRVIEWRANIHVNDRNKRKNVRIDPQSPRIGSIYADINIDGTEEKTNDKEDKGATTPVEAIYAVPNKGFRGNKNKNTKENDYDLLHTSQVKFTPEVNGYDLLVIDNKLFVKDKSGIISGDNYVDDLYDHCKSPSMYDKVQFNKNTDSLTEP